MRDIMKEDRFLTRAIVLIGVTVLLLGCEMKPETTEL
jgi:hypothetical protein